MDIPPAGDEFSRRRLCPDGACTGIIGPDGRCTECGTYVGAPDTEKVAAHLNQPGSTGQDPGTKEKDAGPPPLLAQEPTQETAPSNQDRLDEADEFSRRRLCPDGACTGIIGPDGRCTECGRRFDD